jgi:hypothetical protein
MPNAPDFCDGFRFLAFNHGTGKILSYGRKAILALAGADLCEPHQAIEILDAGVAGKNLWDRQTPLPLARKVIAMLEAPWNCNLPTSAASFGIC